MKRNSTLLPVVGLILLSFCAKSNAQDVDINGTYQLFDHGKYIECIDIMEEIVSIKKNLYGVDHPEFDQASEKLCEYLNLAAMVELQK